MTIKGNTCQIQYISNSTRVLGPAVRNLLEKYGLSANEMTGTGPRGMLLKGDVLNHVQKRKLTPVPSINNDYVYLRTHLIILLIPAILFSCYYETSSNLCHTACGSQTSFYFCKDTTTET